VAVKITSERLEKIESEILALREQCKEFRVGRSILIPVETLAPEPFDLKRAFLVVVAPVEDEFEATFFDANIGTTGDTEEEAVRDLKALMVDTFEYLERNESRLGPEPARQLAVLRELIQRRP
jgi:hypothetical protein